jgi:hypothetical protein
LLPPLGAIAVASLSALLIVVIETVRYRRPRAELRGAE